MNLQPKSLLIHLLITYLAIDLFTIDYSDRYIQSSIQENTNYLLEF